MTPPATAALATLERWRALLQALGLRSRGAAAGEIHAALLTAHAEPQRRYHDLRHLDAVLAHLDWARAQVAEPAPVELALWFHDAVYRPGSATNERDSAELATRSLRALGADAALARRIERLVMVTVHPSVPRAEDERWVVDVDSAILGQPAAVYDRFERDIRAEYAHVPEAAFRARRARLLGEFLASPAIYHTQPFRDALEGPARANLRRAIDALGDPAAVRGPASR